MPSDGTARKPIGEFLQPGDLLLLILVRGDLLLVALLPLPQVIGIIAGVGDEFCFSEISCTWPTTSSMN